MGQNPMYRAACNGCMQRAMGELAVPKSPELPEKQEETQ